MRLPRVPPAFVGGLAELPSLFAAVARGRRMSRDNADIITGLLPQAIRNAPCFLDRLTGLWRYDFGEPFVSLPDDAVVVGTTMYPVVERLFDILVCARQRLTDDQFALYMSRLASPGKHGDVLFEFAPVLRLPEAIDARHEVRGFGDGNDTVDWLIAPPSGPSIALEVKNRVRDLLEAFARVQVGERASDGTAPAPIHDPHLLFTSVEGKFSPRSPAETVQAVWICTGLKQEETELAAAFAELDPARVHVALLGHWEDDVYVIASNETARDHTCRVLGVRPSRRFVFSRADV